MDFCRNELGLHPLGLYLNLTCSLCYYYTFHSADPLTYPLVYGEDGFLYRENVDETGTVNQTIQFAPTAEDRGSSVYKVGFPDWDLDRHAELWTTCCRAAADCCLEQLRYASDERSCPATWDGWQCWKGASRGATVIGSCPKYTSPLSTPSCSGAAEKTCTADGTWLRHYDLNQSFSKEWSNYTTCANLSPFQHRFLVQIAAYCISIVFLIPALLIFWKCKQLHVQRNFVHINFFLSLLLYAVVLIIFQMLVTGNLLNDFEAFADYYEKVECRLLFAATAYLRLCNYCWMFCEGLFLLRHLNNVFLVKQNFLLYILCGWGLPVIFTGSYVVIRSEESGCWIETRDAVEWILKAPAGAALGVDCLPVRVFKMLLYVLQLNLIFLCYIICLLVKNIQTRFVSDLATFRKSCRAVFVLMPLFGLHFCITAYRPQETCSNQWYFYLNSSLDGLQGFVVAITFCYTNGEVLNVLKGSFARNWTNHAPQSVQREWSVTSINYGAKDPRTVSRSLSTVTRLSGFGASQRGIPLRTLRLHRDPPERVNSESEVVERAELLTNNSVGEQVVSGI